MNDGELNRALLRGQVFENRHDAGRAVTRANELLDRLFEGRLLKLGWWWPILAGILVGVLAALPGPTRLARCLVSGIVAFLLNAVTYLWMQRLRGNLDKARHGNQRVLDNTAHRE